MMRPTGKVTAMILGAVLLCMAAFWITRRIADVAPDSSEPDLGLLWLKAEYGLDETTFGRVRDIHAAYFRECEHRCHELDALDDRLLKDVILSSGMSAHLESELAREDALCHGCRQAMLQHIYEVASVMPLDSGRRFIADVTPLLLPAAHVKRKN
ncbi:MAG: hypothetical protein ABMA01_09650 [Chthoniobacteraceae bacterium]